MSKQDRTSEPLFAPEWPSGPTQSPTRAMRRLVYIDAHSPSGERGIASHATIIANRVMAYDRIAELPHCAFCGEPGATDVYREEGYPDAPCCADEDACHARVLAS